MTGFDKWVRREPDRPAIREGERALSYLELDDASRNLANDIAAKLTTKSQQTIVGFVGQVGLACVIALMASHRRISGFVFLDAANPVEMLERIARNALVDILVTARESVSLGQLLSDRLARPCLLVGGETLPASTAIGRSIESECSAQTQDQKISHIRYTSGSTGQPKGIAISYESLDWALSRLHPTMRTMPEDRFGLFGHFWPLIMFEALRHGASLYAFSPVSMGASRLADEIDRMSISVMATYAALFAQIVNVHQCSLKALRLAHISGEPLNAVQIERFEAVCPSAEIVNSYGSSEFPLIACYRHKRQSLKSQDLVPAGRPFEQQEVFVVDEAGKSLPAGAMGEIMVVSPYVPTAYHRESPLSTRTFRSAKDGRRCYFTGDLGCFDESGQLFLAGRADDQIKIGGNAVRPAEVERFIAQHARVLECAVIVEGDDSAAKRLVCHYVARKRVIRRDLTPDELREDLQQRTCRLTSCPPSLWCMTNCRGYRLVR